VPRDPYEVLGVSRDADDAEIKKAFRRLARQLHPDVNSAETAEEDFKEAAEAYEILSDPERKATYDRYGFDGLRSGGYAPPDFSGFGSLGDIFDAFFGSGAFGGGGRGMAVQGGDVAVAVDVSLEEAAASAATATARSPARRSRRARAAAAPGGCRRSPARRSGRSCAPSSATCAAATAASRASRAASAAGAAGGCAAGP